MDRRQTLWRMIDKINVTFLPSPLSRTTSFITLIVRKFVQFERVKAFGVLLVDSLLAQLKEHPTVWSQTMFFQKAITSG